MLHVLRVFWYSRVLAVLAIPTDENTVSTAATPAAQSPGLPPSTATFHIIEPRKAGIYASIRSTYSQALRVHSRIIPQFMRAQNTCES